MCIAFRGAGKGRGVVRRSCHFDSRMEREGKFVAEGWYSFFFAMRDKNQFRGHLQCQEFAFFFFAGETRDFGLPPAVF